MDRRANTISRRGSGRHPPSPESGSASAAPLWPAIMVAICSGYLARGKALEAASGLAEAPARWTPAPPPCRPAIANDDAFALGAELWDIFGPALAIDDLSRIMTTQLPRLTDGPDERRLFDSRLSKGNWRE